ncbi:hypothetical protein [Imbroritus primus]|uniref:hypothetical protein n=1 Tax=Imbroritus primus TaxID=3058603 RepID=UPI003D16110B
MSADEKPLVIGWKLSSLNAKVASVRYRALFPLLALREQGVSSKVFASGSVRNLTGIDALVIVKSFTADDIALAHAAVEKGIPVIYDLCDNVFAERYGYGSVTAPADIVRQIGMIATAFVTPTDVLADVMRDQLRDGLPVYVVPDGIETGPLAEAAAAEIEQTLEAARRRPLIERIRDSQDVRKFLELLRTGSVRGIAHRLAKYAYRKLEPVRARILGRASRVAPRPMAPALLPRSQNDRSTPQAASDLGVTFEGKPASPDARRLLWYGNHGALHGGRFGMIDLVDNRAALERIAREFDVELVVVSNHAKKFEQLIAPLAIPSRYVEWSPARVQEELARADIVLVPNSCDAFSLGKSANRTALALMAGHPVVATPTPALVPLGDCIEAGDFYIGIRRYLTDPQRVAAHIAIARERCEQLYGQAAIAGAWLSVLDAVRSHVLGAAQLVQPELVLVANLVQDVEFIRPLVAVARERGIPVAIWASTSMICRWPYTLAALAESGAPLRVLAETKSGAVVPRFPHSVRAVLTVADTNLGPHRFSNSITQAANKAGIVTGTLQHGFENVGLTYSDDLHVIERIEFDARRIFVWGNLSLLHPRVSEKTRLKCISVGCPKAAETAEAVLPSIVPAGKPVVGIFENLHWHRYDDAYRSFFLDGASRLAVAHPDVTFIVKPHNAGRWLTTRFDGELSLPANLLIADPSEAQWEGLTAAGMLPHLSGVITSPSTVALDAARVGLPVAVVAHDLKLDNYAPLYLIQSTAHWNDFATSLFDGTHRQALVDASAAFVARVVLPGDAAARIVEHLLNPDLDAQGLAA